MRVPVIISLSIAAFSACDSGEPVYEARATEQAPTSYVLLQAEKMSLVQNTYNVAYDICDHDRSGIYKQAGSRDLHEAAEWFSQGSKEGEHRAASYRGCMDGLLRKEKKF
ncbi:hypothetical protein FHS01_004875 [Longimicrobium terrae]|uniref:Uncharacterized protein n=2 Tax=Longimicrobium terrae TaxID=1639882 RepID=A0A841H4J7_9BACT|nr:hypothetical protein [Longimicrobium terrae]MBB6073051.1 hypothetical protein [Longimicrobium terrae]